MADAANTVALKWSAHATIQKWHREEDLLAGNTPDEVLEVPGNLLTTAGLSRIGDLILGAGGQAMNATHCRIGVGDSSTAATVADTALGAATNKLYKLVTTGPSNTNGVLTASVTFASAEANWAWNEWGLDVGTADSTTVTAPFINHKIASMGTKASGAAWAFSVTITLS